MRAEENAKFLYLLVALNVIPHYFNVANWVIALSLTFILWRYLSYFKNLFVPGRISVQVIGLFAAAGVFLEYGTIFGDQSSAALLVLTVTLKLFEKTDYRNIMVVTILCYFLLMAKLIDSQSLGMTIFMVFDLVLITALLSLHHSPIDQGKGKALIKRAAGLAFISMPFVLVLFFLFPRFNMAFLRKNEEAKGKTGFSNRLDPGSIMNLVKSDELIFRAKLFGEKIPKDRLYWRGATLDQVDGLRWTQSGGGALFTKRKFQAKNVSYDEIMQEIYVEPLSSKFLFTLDWPSSLEFPSEPNRKRGFSDRTFRSRSALDKKEFYRVKSIPFSRQVEWVPQNLKRYLDIKIPEGSRFAKIVEKFKSLNLRRAETLIQELKLHFTSEGFYYSLTPPAMNSVDDFLVARVGFCEHYAGFTASLFRALGVPARVVVGFHGGQESFLGDYFMVRSMDAHAWIEYWEKERASWVRMDPTAFVAPIRISGGSESLLNELGRNTGQLYGVEWMEAFLGRDFLRSYLQLQKVIDQLDIAWVSFLLKYDFNYQRRFLENLGLQNIKDRLTMFGITLLFLVVFIGAMYIFLSRRYTLKSYRLKSQGKFMKRLHKMGIYRRGDEGPLAFGERIVDLFPEESSQLEEIFAEMYHLDYSAECEDHFLRDLQLLEKINDLHLSKRKVS